LQMFYANRPKAPKNFFRSNEALQLTDTSMLMTALIAYSQG